MLHAGSFADDPTRLWRLARYAARLGFAVEPDTARRSAAAADARRRSAASRLGNELRLALREPDPLGGAAGRARPEPGLLRRRADHRAARPGEAVALALLRRRARADLVVLAACCAPVDAGAAAWPGWTTSASPPPSATSSPPARGAPTLAPLRGRADAVRDRRAPRAARRSRSSRWRRRGAERRARWLDELRHVRLEITGDDLLAAGVPEGPSSAAGSPARWTASSTARLAGREAELAAALG